MRAFAGDAAAARVLAGAADRDVSAMQHELSANRKVLNALRETQIEHGAKIDALQTKSDNLAEVVAQNTMTLADHSQKLDALGGRLDSVDGRLDAVETKLDTAIATMDDRFNTVISLIERRDST